MINPHILCHQPRRGGFTKVELLVTLGSVAILIALAALLTVHLREKALRVRCQKNVQTLTTGLRSFASDHNGLFPDCTTENPSFNGASWPWELSPNLTAALDQYGLTRSTYYCPANPTMNDDRHWNFAEVFHARSRVLGYVFLLNGTETVPAELARVNLKGDSAAHSPAASELTADVVASMGGNYSELRGFLKDRSNHMSGSQPRGGNIGFVDGHVEWRDYKDMKHRIVHVAVWDF